MLLNESINGEWLKKTSIVMTRYQRKKNLRTLSLDGHSVPKRHEQHIVAKEVGSPPSAPRYFNIGEQRF